MEKEAKIHPSVLELVKTMYEFAFDYTEINIIFDQLSINVEEINPNNFKRILLSLNLHDGIAITEDILKNEKFQLTKDDLEKISVYNKTLEYHKNRIPDMHEQLERITRPKLEHYVNNIPKPSIPEEHYWSNRLLDLLKRYYNLYYKDHILTINGAKSSRNYIINDEDIIDKKFNDYFYKLLVKEINNVYKFGYYLSTLILIRKLFENLLIDFYENKFSTNRNIFYDFDQDRPKDFSVLVSILWSQKNSFINNRKLLDQLYLLITELRNVSNLNVHNKFSIPTKRNIDDLNIHKLLELLLLFFNDNAFTVKVAN